MKEKIFHKLGVSEKEFEKVSSAHFSSAFDLQYVVLFSHIFSQYKFAIITGGRPRYCLENLDTPIELNSFRPNPPARKF